MLSIFKVTLISLNKSVKRHWSFGATVSTPVEEKVAVAGGFVNSKI